MRTLAADVIIVGAGPCGITLANHLGIHGVSTILVDSSPDVLDYPRAVGVDDEALRSWQTVGLADTLISDMIRYPPLRYHNSKGRCFAALRPRSQPFGWPRRNMFLQPLLEATVRKGLTRFPQTTCLFGCSVDDLEQTTEGVTANAVLEGEPVVLKAQYLVGADGGRSTVRRLVGIELNGETNPSKWLVVDVQNDTLDEPFSGVYCSPTRPHMSIDLPYGFRRFEFMLAPEDNEDEVQQPESLARLLQPHYPQGMRLPHIKRSRIYMHHSRIADRFRAGRVFLAGDAAHLQPPFFGQGMNSGIRDATNLGWKLAAVLKGNLAPHVLDSYEDERREHALAMVNFATWVGRLYQPRNRFTEMLRDVFFDMIQVLPSVRDYILQLRFKPMPTYTRGLILPRTSVGGKHPAVGTMFMQPRVERRDKQVCRLDDALGSGFAVVGINVDPSAHLSPQERSFWDKLGAVRVQVNRSRAGAHLTETASAETHVLDDIDGQFRDWLEDNTPLDTMVLRPDRYVAAICRHQDLGQVTQELARVFGAKP